MGTKYNLGEQNESYGDLQGAKLKPTGMTTSFCSETPRQGTLTFVGYLRDACDARAGRYVGPKVVTQNFLPDILEMAPRRLVDPTPEHQ